MYSSSGQGKSKKRIVADNIAKALRLCQLCRDGKFGDTKATAAIVFWSGVSGIAAKKVRYDMIARALYLLVCTFVPFRYR